MKAYGKAYVYVQDNFAVTLKETTSGCSFIYNSNYLETHEFQLPLITIICGFVSHFVCHKTKKGPKNGLNKPFFGFL